MKGEQSYEEHALFDRVGSIRCHSGGASSGGFSYRRVRSLKGNFRFALRNCFPCRSGCDFGADDAGAALDDLVHCGDDLPLAERPNRSAALLQRIWCLLLSTLLYPM